MSESNALIFLETKSSNYPPLFFNQSSPKGGVVGINYPDILKTHEFSSKGTKIIEEMKKIETMEQTLISTTTMSQTMEGEKSIPLSQKQMQ